MGRVSFAILVISLAIASACLKSKDNRQSDSCQGRCGDAPDSNFDCQCNSVCSNFGDCCSDYTDTCTSCVDRCGISYDASLPCQCNDQCQDYGNCCTDYCGNCDTCTPPVTITDDDLRQFAESIFAADINSAGDSVVVNRQGLVSGGCPSDNANAPMYSLFDSNTIYSIPTISLLVDMYDNYDPDVTIVEDHTTSEQAEEDAFLDAVLQTQVFTLTFDFLTEKGLFSGDLAAFKTKLYELWFEPYDRDGTSASILGSSGFEHVFMGEIKNGDVSGFHSWIHYGYEADLGNTNYYGYFDDADFGGGIGGITNRYTWNGHDKCKGGFFVGTSPELDLAAFTVCFFAKEGSLCPMQYNNVQFDIQTYNQNDGKDHIGSAYPIF